MASISRNVDGCGRRPTLQIGPQAPVRERGRGRLRIVRFAFAGLDRSGPGAGRSSCSAHDPIVAETLRRSTGFGWRDPDLPLSRTPHALRIMGEASEIGLRDGYTVPLTTIEGEPGGMTFAGAQLQIAPEHRGMLTLVASYAFGQALLVRRQARTMEVALSPRERETLQWTAEGKTDWEIGEIMGISAHGVDSHLRCVRTKLGVRNRPQAVVAGLRQGIIY